MGTMITIPLEHIKENIKTQKNLSEKEINSKIEQKLKELSGLISEEGAAHIVANELGVKLFISGEKLTVKKVLVGMKNVEVTGKVTRKFELREFKTEKRSGKLASLVIADETGFIRIVLWNEQTDKFNNIKEGDILTLEGGYVRDNNGRKEIHLSNNASITINPAGVSIDVQDQKESVKRKKLSELEENDDNVEVLATVVQVFDIRYFEIDPETNKRAVQKDGKYYSGEKEVPEVGYSYVMNIFLDDGTDNIRTVLWKNQIQNFLSMSDEQILKFREDPASFENIKTDLLGSIIKIVGRINKNQAYDRLELIANMITKEVNPQEEIDKAKASEQLPKASTESNTSPIKKDISEVEKAVMEEEKISSPNSEEMIIEEDALSIDDLENVND